MRVRKLTFAAVAVAAGLALTACNGDDVAVQPDESSAASASSSGDGSGTGGSQQDGGKDSAGDDSAGSGSGANAEVGKCRTDELEVTATDTTIEGDADGSVAVTFKNGGGHDCALSGYAGVDLKTSEGDLSAKRSGQEAGSMTLKDGESVSFNINYPVNDSGGSGIKITGLVVTPPDETKSVTLEWPGSATLPVTDGSGSVIEVGPMGSAGQGGAS